MADGDDPFPADRDPRQQVGEDQRLAQRPRQQREDRGRDDRDTDEAEEIGVLHEVRDSTARPSGGRRHVAAGGLGQLLGPGPRCAPRRGLRS